MKCMSCQGEIDPRWKHALEINVCPNCGSGILPEHLKNLLHTLGSAMKELQQYPEQLDDWLLSNYDYIKTTSPNLPIYLPKEKVKQLNQEIIEQDEKQPQMMKIKMKMPDGSIQEEEIMVEKKMSDAQSKSFFDRATDNIGKSGKTAQAMKAQVADPQEAPKSAPKSIPERTQYFKTLKQQIEEEASSGIVKEASLANMIAFDGSEVEATPEDVAEMQAQISGGDAISSGLPGSNMGDDDPMTDRILAMNRQASKNNPVNKSVNEQQDLIRMQNAVSDAQNRMGSGSFSRG